MKKLLELEYSDKEPSISLSGVTGNVTIKELEEDPRSVHALKEIKELLKGLEEQDLRTVSIRELAHRVIQMIETSTRE